MSPVMKECTVYVYVWTMCCTQGWVAFLPFHRLESDWSVLLYFHRSGTYISVHWQTQWMTTFKSQATYHQIQTVAKGNSITESEAMFMKSMNRLKICDVGQGAYKLVGPVNHTPLSRQARHAALHFGHTRMKELATQLFQWIPPQAHALTRVYTKNRAGNRIVCLLRHRWSSVPCRRYVLGVTSPRLYRAALQGHVTSRTSLRDVVSVNHHTFHADFFFSVFLRANGE